jgi:hypothetical protein
MDALNNSLDAEELLTQQQQQQQQTSADSMHQQHQITETLDSSRAPGQATAEENVNVIDENREINKPSSIQMDTANNTNANTVSSEAVSKLPNITIHSGPPPKRNVAIKKTSALINKTNNNTDMVVVSNVSSSLARSNNNNKIGYTINERIEPADVSSTKSNLNKYLYF